MHAGLSSRLRRLASLAVALAAGLVSPSSLVAAFSVSTTSSPGPLQPLQYEPGSSVKLSLGTGGAPAPTGAYQWLHDEQPVPGATGDSLTLAPLAIPDSGNYRLRVTSGNVVTYSDNTVTLNVLSAPPLPLDPTFAAEIPAGLKPTVFFPAAADGSLVIRCIPSTASYDDGTAYTTIRLRSDGSRDATLNLGRDRLLAVLPNGGLIIASPPYRLHPDGSPDPLITPGGFDASGGLSTGAVQADGKILLLQNQQIFRFNADGSPDPTFVGTPLSGNIDGLYPDSAGRVLVSASRFEAQYYLTYGILDRLTSTGQRDPTFHALNNARYWYFPTPLPGGGIFLEYYWSNYEGPILERLHDDGTLDTHWSAPETSYYEAYADMVVDPTRSGIVWTRDLRRFLLTDTGLTYDPTFSAGILGRLDLVLPDGKLLVTRSLSNLDGSTSPQLVRLRTDDSVATRPPAAFIGPGDATPSRGSNLILTSSTSGTGPFTYQWLALDGQSLPTDTSSAQLTLANFSSAQLGRYQLRVTGPGGVSVLSNIVRAILGAPSSYLSNLSGRALAGTGEDTIIAGLSTRVSAGAVGVSTLIRGAGPALKPLGVANFLPNPTLDLYNAWGQLIANNDQWSVTPDAATAVTTAAHASGAFSFEPGSNDAALLGRFPSGNATVMLKSQDAGSGVALLEIYQLFPTGNESSYQSLLNLSFRARTAPGEATVIAGFVIIDPHNFNRPARVLLRAVGPTLISQGIVHPLDNPVLTVYDSAGKLVAQNDDWSVSPASNPTASTDLAAAAKQVGAFDLPTPSHDAALLLDLPAGTYTMHATAAEGPPAGGSAKEGVVLLEIYLVQ